MKDTIKVYIQPAFLLCAAALAIAAGTMSFAIEGFSGFLEKTPLPLKKSLDLLDEKSLAPYTVVAKRKIENKEVVESLGTQDYIQWTLEDSDEAADSPVRRYLLFITYYDCPDLVPHVPEECYLGGGYQKLAADSVTFEIDRGGVREKINGRHLVFGSTDVDHWRSAKFSVLYFFRVNGSYAANRQQARVILNKNLFGKSSYFCKIELAFNQKLVAPAKEDAVMASQKLLSVILPILETEHWPDWGKR